MSKRNEIEFLFQYAQLDATQDFLDDIENEARTKPEEFQNLVRLFENQKCLLSKFLLSNVLVNLNYAPVKQFFLDVLQGKQTVIQPYASKQESPEEYVRAKKIWSTLNLLKMHEACGLEFLKQLIPSTDVSDINWIISELNDPEDSQKATAFSLRALLELADFSEKIASKINRADIEERIKKLESK